ncbi:putative pentatricopeptide repeat-containing protein At3g05240 [Carica papaya]|uniref:putative pentatricopeptide repeat-containing protein At3g05240 n=1 Tax=Carica papaya TaxID=3649 RepID=UPI000B8C9AFD|nr:putative pentatricopeptide repeat-containing protein At3g05240 [Carica papaya]
MRCIHNPIKSVYEIQNPCRGITYILQKCVNTDQLCQVHAHLTTTGLVGYPPFASKLVEVFASIVCPATISVARSIAERINGLDTYAWNTIIRGFLEVKDAENALLVYSHVRNTGLEVHTRTLLFALKACGLMPTPFESKQIHAQIFVLGFVSEIIIQTALLDVYGSFAKLDWMQQVFDEMPQRDLVSWNSLVTAYARQNRPYQALVCLRKMLLDNLKPNKITVVSLLSACSLLKFLREGKSIHGYLIKKLIDIDVFVYNSLIAMYSKCQCLFSACRIFQLMPTRNVISWTAMINGYGDNDNPNEALALLKDMESQNVKPDEITMLGLISMCSKLGNSELGNLIELYVEKYGLVKRSVCIANALIDMHAKLGNIKKCCQIFDGMGNRIRTLVSWTSIIQALAMNGHGISALVRFCQMQREGIKPDEVVFLNVLSACSHGGLVEEGQKCFDSMIKDYQMEPWMEHYGCMVDLLCRVGLIKEAIEFIDHMPVKPDLVMWRSLLSACQIYGNTSIASLVIKKRFIDQGIENCEDYLVLSKFYATMGDWHGAKQVRKEMEVKGLMKLQPGRACIRVNKFLCC